MRIRWLIAIVVLGACSTREASQPARAVAADAAPAATAAGGTGSCPPTGRWAPCTIMYRLERSGFVPTIDSTAKPAETALAGTPMIIKIGRNATLEVHLYPDSAARAAAGAKLDRTHLIDANAEQTIERERTLIENVNVIGLLTSINGHQRERVSDALMAGPPSAPKP